MLAAIAKKLHLVGYNTKDNTYRLWDPADPFKITNSAEVSFREKNTHDVVRPKEGHDPFPEQTKSFKPGIDINGTNDQRNQEPAVAPAAPVAPQEQ